MTASPDHGAVAVTAEARHRSTQFNTRARRQFDGWAASYDRSLLNHFLFRPSYLAVLEEIGRRQKERGGNLRVLDIGCGTGTLASLLSQSVWPLTVYGLDYSPQMCHRAQAKTNGTTRSDRVQFVAGDSEHLPFESGSFDFVTCANSFHHYPHQQAVMREMKRVLRPGGSAVLLDGFRDNVIGWVVFDVIITRIEKSVYHAPWHEIHAMFEAAGFRNIRRRKLNLLFPVLLTAGEA